MLVVTQLALQSMVSLAIAEDTAGPSKSLRGGEHQNKVSVAQCVCPPLRFVEYRKMFQFHTYMESGHTFRLIKQEESVLLSMVVSTKVIDKNVFFFFALDRVETKPPSV